MFFYYRKGILCLFLLVFLIAHHSMTQELQSFQPTEKSSFFNDLVFDDLNPIYRPVIYSETSILDFPCHFYLYYTIPVLDAYKFLNVRFTNADGISFWGIENLSLPPYDVPISSRYLISEVSGEWQCETFSPLMTAEWRIDDV
jgi:hypothetical protein